VPALPLGAVALVNPYLAFFLQLPAAFRRDPSTPIAALEPPDPAWVSLKTAIAAHFAWAVPTEEAIETIHRHAEVVVEIGAGSGYWAWLMRQAGIRVAAYDRNPPPFTWTPVSRGDEGAVSASAADALFLCWPPWASDMAVNALTLHRGRYVIYVGEWMGGSAEWRFFASLAHGFRAIASAAIPQWQMRDDRLIVFERRLPVA